MKKDTEVVQNPTEVLRAGGFRATTSRIQLLRLLADVGAPLSIQMIAQKWKGVAPAVTTLYRSLTDLSGAGIVRRVDFNTGIAHFEYTPDRPHHHHIVCSTCGRVEEVDFCPLGDVDARLLKPSAHFTSIYSHTLEFFGRCTVCAA